MVRCMPLSSPPRKLPLGSPVPIAAPHATDGLDRVPAAWPPFRKRQTGIHLSCHPHRHKMAWSAVARRHPRSFLPRRITAATASNAGRHDPGALESAQVAQYAQGTAFSDKKRAGALGSRPCDLRRHQPASLRTSTGTFRSSCCSSCSSRRSSCTDRPPPHTRCSPGRWPMCSPDRSSRPTDRTPGPRAENGREHDAPALNGFHFATGLMPGL